MAKRESVLAKVARMTNQLIEGGKWGYYERERKANAEFSRKKREEEARTKAARAAGKKGVVDRTEDVETRLGTAGLTKAEIERLKKKKK